MTKDNIIKYIGYISSVIFIDEFNISVLQVKILSILMFIDIITGILKSYFCKGGNSVRSKVLYAGVTTKLLILLTPIVLQLLGMGVGIDLSFLVKLVFCYFIVSESYSFFNNALSIKKRENLKEYDSFTIIAKVLRGYILSLLEITRTSIETHINNDGGKNEVKKEEEEKSEKI